MNFTTYCRISVPFDILTQEASHEYCYDLRCANADALRGVRTELKSTVQPCTKQLAGKGSYHFVALLELYLLILVSLKLEFALATAYNAWANCEHL